jgi:alpha-tubulin suppressor-like RCC1 family protein
MSNAKCLAVLLATSLGNAACDDPFAARETRFYKAVATGAEHTCAVAMDGAAYCWGKGSEGQLGTGNTDNSFTPARVQGSFRFAHIAAGLAHTCALTTDGTALCWGSHWQVQPVPLSATNKFTSITAGSEHTCAIGVDSLTYCWGDNTYGQLGDSTTTANFNTPSRVTRGIRFVQIGAGRSHTCGVIATGDAYCWGRNEHGQLGDSTAGSFSAQPVRVEGDIKFAQIDAGGIHTCGVAFDTKFYCWGGNAFGELGLGAAVPFGLVWSYIPVPISQFFPTGRLISAGEFFTCAIGLNGNARCWGHGEFGQLGNGARVTHYHPQPIHLQPERQHVVDLLRFDMISAGGVAHACGIVEGSIYCWGTGTMGQLGAAAHTFSSLPQRVSD